MSVAQTPGHLAQAWAALASDPGASGREAQAALDAAPGDTEAAVLLAAARRRLGDVAGSATLLRPLMRGRPRLEAAWFEWGMTLSAMGEEAEAVDALREAVRLQPRFANAWRALGDQLILLGAGVPAGEAYARGAVVSVRDPALAGAAAALAAGKAGEAGVVLRAHLLRRPGDLQARHLLAEAVLRGGGIEEAEALLTSCLQAQARFSEARHSLAILLYATRRFGRAAVLFRQLHAAAPHQPCLRVLLVVCLVETGDFAGAIPLYEAMLRGFHDQPAAWLRYGHALKTVGREADAVAAYRECIRLAPSWAAGAYQSLADVKTAVFSDAEIGAMQGRLKSASITTMDRSQLHYALGHAMDQIGCFEEAFTHFAQGAGARRGLIDYDPAEISAFVAKSRSVLTAAAVASVPQAARMQPVPIFIVGLPRAGSTLVEQILASHRDVEGTAELREIGMIGAELRGAQTMSALPGIVAELDSEARALLGTRYLDTTRQYRRTDRAFFTDKMPDNFLHLGLICAILPDALIVDVRRDPMAAGFAAFRQFFQLNQKAQDYTYDLAEIGRYYRDYRDLMAHFDQVVPGRVHRVHYERLVTEFEREVRGLLAYCNLSFDPACLRFWETKRAVQTPSAQQVRRPVFRESLQAWRNYEPWLGALREALED